MPEELVNSNNLYRTVFESVNEAVSILDADYTVLGANRAFLEEAGLEEAEAVGRKCYGITHGSEVPCEALGERCPLVETLATGRHATAEHIHSYRGGEETYVAVSTSPIRDGAGRITCVVHISRDITEQKVTEARIRASLSEKEILLREIHHRVKNNLQVISSLLNLQSSYFTDEKSVRAFRDAQNRIRSMAVLHERLYKSRDMARVDFRGYVKGLLHELVRSCGVSPGVSIEDRIKNISFGMDTAIPCGLVINELLSNALKHAFVGRKRGRVEISIRLAGEDEYELVVKDDGAGFPSGFDYRNAGTLGLRLVRTLVEEQLEGRIEIRHSAGTEVRVRFREQIAPGIERG